MKRAPTPAVIRMLSTLLARVLGVFSSSDRGSSAPAGPGFTSEPKKLHNGSSGHGLRGLVFRNRSYGIRPRLAVHKRTSGPKWARRDAGPIRRFELTPVRRRASKPARFAALVLTTVVALALTSSSAFAAQQYPFVGQLKIHESLNGLAVDGKTGDALVSDFNGSGQVVEVFDASGTLVKTLDGSNTPAGSFGNGYLPVAADDSSGAIYVADQTANVVDVLDSSGSYVCQITGAGSSTTSPSECDSADPGTPAGKLGTPGAVAVDQATGDLYVYDAVNAVIDVFGPTGQYLRQINGASTAAGSFSTFVRSLAIDDKTGQLLVADGGPDLIYVFDAATGAYVTTWDGSAGANPPGTPSGSFGHGDVGLAVDNSTGDVYVSDSSDTVVDQLDQSGNYLGQLTGTPGGGAFAQPEQVAVGQATGRLYVVDGSARVVDIFSDQQVTVPDATTGSATGLTATTTTLHGSVNPDGIQVTDCHFDYGTTTSYGQTAQCLRDDNNSTDIGSGTSDVPVHADITGLTPGTTYHFRLEATNANGTNDGTDQTLTTLPVPVIDGATATNVTPSSADLNAQINPEGLDTTYHFQYGTSIGYGSSVPVPDADIGSGTSDVTVSQQITGLSANTDYHWRVVATNANGTTTGVDHTFVYDTSGPGLPDGRAYEMVTPPQKNGALIGDVLTGLPTDFAGDGSRVIASSIQCFADTGSCTGLRATAGSLYEFTRTATGWVASSMTPTATLYPINSAWTASADAGTALFSVPTAPDGEDDFYARQPDGSFTHIGPVSPPSAGSQGPIGAGTVLATTVDLTHVVWSVAQPGPLWPFDTTQPNQNSLYEYAGTGTQPVLVGVSGGPGSTDLISVCGTVLGDGTSAPGIMSSDGSIVYFTAYGKLTASNAGCVASASPAADVLDARVDGTSADAHTVPISQRSPADCTTAACTSSPAGDANFEGASTDGSKAFFTSTQELTDNASEDSHAGDTARGQACASTTGPNGCNLYLYDSTQPAGHELIDASAGDSSGGGPRVQGVVGISSDGSHAYFVAQGVLTATANSQGQTAQAGAENLYVYERDQAHPNGQTTFISTLPASDAQNWSSPQGTVANVSPDGRFLVFISRGDLTADDSSSGGRQVFRYDAQTGSLQRISIGSNGFGDNGNFAGSGCEPSYCPQDESIVPPLMTRAGVPRTDPTMSDDGTRVFFESPHGLTPGALDDVRIATNGDGTGNPIYAQNIYEWEQAGAGSCPASQSSGCVYLISDGHDVGVYAGQSDVHLIGTDTTGVNAFFKTSDQLVPQDTDTEEDIYDARIGGGFPYTPPAAGCAGDNCQGSPSGVPATPTAATLTFSGPGNSASAPTARTGNVKVVKRSVKGSAFFVTVKVPAGGRVTITGAGVRTAHKSVSKAGTCRLRIVLTARERRLLKRKRRLKLELRVAYAPLHGSSSHVTFSITDKA